MAIMKMFWGKTHIIGGLVDGKRVLIHRDGHINPKDLEKLTVEELYFFASRRCNGSLKEALIKFISSDKN